MATEATIWDQASDRSAIRRVLLGVLTCLLCGFPAAPVFSNPKPPPPPTVEAVTSSFAQFDQRSLADERIEKSMKSAKDWLFKVQANGNWETVVTPDPKGDTHSVTGAQHTGLTALAVYSLLSAGESTAEPHVALAINFLRKTPTQGVYALSMRCLVWSSITLDPATKKIAQGDLTQLIRSMRANGPAKGMFYYLSPVDRNDVAYDHSASQLAMLGIWSMQRQGFEVSDRLWAAADETWRAHQKQDGSWPYIVSTGSKSENISSASMTSAGVATLYLTQDSLRPTGGGCKARPGDANIVSGTNWLANNFDSVFDHARQSFNSDNQAYTLFGISRIGVASGRANFGKVDWYQRGTDFILKTQHPDGSWSGGWLAPASAPTSLGLLFLAYGSAPVMVNKLEYKTEPTADKSNIEAWNNRPQDAYNFTQWLGRQTERRANWQVTDLSAILSSDQRGAPILYIAGDKELKFSDDEREKFKQFIEQGGIIIGNADCGSDVFAKSFEKFGASMFPDYEFQVLPLSHPIFTRGPFPTGKWKKQPNIRSMSNGVRDLMVISSTDISKALQQNDSRTGSQSFELLGDICHYASDKLDARRRGTNHIIRRNASTTNDGAVSLARLKYAGNWNPEPGGWVQMAALLHNDHKIDLKVKTVQLGDDSLKEFKIAHLTGTGSFTLSGKQRGELMAFAEGGGTIIIDAAGGQSEFATAAEKELTAIFGKDAEVGLAKPLSIDESIFHLPNADVKEVKYRDFAREKLGKLNTPTLRGIQKGGRTVVFYSREDLSGGLVGQRVDGIEGYEPRSAIALMRNLILRSAE
ncbi:DUF4159 domain-containing protein [soil metagenome]